MADHAGLQGDIRPHATEDDVREMLQRLYGMTVLSIKKLNAYDDQNFHIKVAADIRNVHIERLNEQGYVFKIMNLDDTKNEKQHLKERNGTQTHIVRLLEYIEGDILASVALTPELSYQGGVFLAEFHHALEGYVPKDMDKDDFLWNLKNVPMVRAYVNLDPDEEHRAIAMKILEKWDEVVIPGLKELPRNLIHSDFNEQNILISTEEGKVSIKGILDFQDSSYGYTVFDIAIYIMYMMIQAKEDQIDTGGYALSGFLSKQKLNDTELSLLYWLVCGRFIQSLLLGLYNFSIHKDPYLLVTQPGWAVLKKLWEIPPETLIKRWLSIMQH